MDTFSLQSFILRSLTKYILSNCLQDIIEEFSKVFILIDTLDEITFKNTTGVLSTFEITRKWNLPCLHLLGENADLTASGEPYGNALIVVSSAGYSKILSR